MERTTNIPQSEVAVWVDEAIAKFGTNEKTARSNRIGSIINQLIDKKQLGQNPQLLTVLNAAASLYNLFYDITEDHVINEDGSKNYGNWVKLFSARYELSKLESIKAVPIQAQHAIFQAIEGQLAEDMAVPLCRNDVGSPGIFLANAVFIAHELTL